LITAEQYQTQRQALDPDAMRQEAREKAGLDDFGDGVFMIAFDKMCECYARDADFHAEGLASYRKQTVNELVNRLRFEEDLKRHPEILEEDVTDPMIIIGLPRSGTTKMHRLVAADESLLKTFTWQLSNPAPFPDASPREVDPRIAATVEFESLLEKNAVQLAGAERANDIRLGHFYGELEVQEDCGLLAYTFNDDYQRITRVPCVSFREWLREREAPSYADNYRYLYRLFQYLQWQQGGKQGRKWIMKNTGHPGHLDQMMAIHPNATIMHVHRDPRTTIASIAKLGRGIWSTRLKDIDSHFCGQYYSNVMQWQTDRYLRFRDEMTLDDRIQDVFYPDVRSNPLPPIREMYSRAGYELTPRAEQQMIDWDLQNEEAKYGKNVYDLADFGLSKEQIERDFGEYIARFIDKA